MGANAQTSVPLFVANAILTAAQQNISAATGVPVFATTATRDAAFGGSNKVLAEGQLAYIEASDIVQYYTGSAWATLAPTSSKIAQVQTVSKADAFSSTSTSYVDVTGLSVSITPTLNTSTILVMTGLALSAGASRGYSQLVRNSTNIAISTGFATSNQTSLTYGNNYMSQYVSIAYVDSPATTSATTYKFQVKADSGTTVYVNAQAGATAYGNFSTLTVMEILA